MSAVTRWGDGIVHLLVVLAVACAATGCSVARGDVDRAGVTGRFTASSVRACLDKYPGTHHGLIFRTTTRPSDTFVGVIMMDLTTKPARTATVGIAIYDDVDLLAAYEERARKDPTDEVTRVSNAVVSYHTSGSPNLALGERWVDACLRSASRP
ncbi:MAG TPA: hypothetical protein VF165_19345 [Nocardioidaceae bacterium]